MATDENLCEVVFACCRTNIACKGGGSKLKVRGHKLRREAAENFFWVPPTFSSVPPLF